MQCLLFAGSLRLKSLNKMLLFSVQSHLNNTGIHNVLLNLVDFSMPVYNFDIEKDQGIPESVYLLADYIKKADALIIATPEYNGSIAAPLKNMVDWLSRCTPMPLAEKHLLLLSASPGKFGGVRGIWHTRIPFEVLGVYVFPQMFCLEFADKQFNDSSLLIDNVVHEKLKTVVDSFILYVKAHV